MDALGTGSDARPTTGMDAPGAGPAMGLVVAVAGGMVVLGGVGVVVVVVGWMVVVGGVLGGVGVVVVEVGWMVVVGGVLGGLGVVVVEVGWMVVVGGALGGLGVTEPVLGWLVGFGGAAGAGLAVGFGVGANDPVPGRLVDFGGAVMDAGAGDTREIGSANRVTGMGSAPGTGLVDGSVVGIALVGAFCSGIRWRAAEPIAGSAAGVSTGLIGGSAAEPGIGSRASPVAVWVAGPVAV